MKAVFASLLALSLVGAIGITEAAAAKKKSVKRDHYSRHVNENYPGRPIRDIDETQYYERLSEKIPFGSGTWWRQRQLENPVP
jgi:hypothetical protein